jgi:hypothetical protein
MNEEMAYKTILKCANRDVVINLSKYLDKPK